MYVLPHHWYWTKQASQCYTITVFFSLNYLFYNFTLQENIHLGVNAKVVLNKHE